MKKILIIILCLAFFSLACLGAGGAASIEQVASTWSAPTLTIVVVPGASVEALPTATATPSESCAVVIANEALHLRGSALESGEVLTWLKRGDVVELIGDTSPDWWRVKFEGFKGFARSVYLQRVECVK